MKRPLPARRTAAFTLIEILMAITIFALVVAAIYATWTIIIKSSKVGQAAAAQVQRERVAVHVIEQALMSARSFQVDLDRYAFEVENGDAAVLSFVARLPKSFPRGGRFGDFDVRRVTFQVEAGENYGEKNLVLRQNPILMDLDEDEQKHPLILAHGVKEMFFEFWDAKKGDWSDTWTQSNTLPRQVRFTIGFTKGVAQNTYSSEKEEIVRQVSIPTTTVPPVWQGGPNAGRPGQPPPGVPPGGQPGGNPNPTGGKVEVAVKVDRGVSTYGQVNGGSAGFSPLQQAGCFGRRSGINAALLGNGAARKFRRSQGIALIIVMICITALAILAAGMAYAMKVETKLAMNANSETELTWLGVSGVEFARYVLAQQLAIVQEPYDSLNQKWAGGPGGWASSNNPLAEISLDNYQLGNGKFSIKIVDQERKVNINMADQPMLEQAFRLIGVDAGDFTPLAGSIMDWIDADDTMHAGGAESAYYQSLDPPYYARNRPMDDLSDLLLVKGVTPDIYWGGVISDHPTAAFLAKQRTYGSNPGMISHPVGMVNIFTPMSSGRININTADATVLQMLPGVDENIAGEIIKYRSGPDGADGTADDTPFHNAGELINVPGINPQVVGAMQRLADVRSRTFEVTVDAEINGYHRQFVAMVGRNSTRDLPVLTFSWK